MSDKQGRIGELRHRVELQRNTPTRDSITGAEVPAWETYKTVWARIDPQAGDKKSYGQTVLPEATHIIEIYWRAGVRPQDRVAWGDRVFIIEHVHTNDEWSQRLHLHCRECPAGASA